MHSDSIRFSFVIYVGKIFVLLLKAFYFGGNTGPLFTVNMKGNMLCKNHGFTGKRVFSSCANFSGHSTNDYATFSGLVCRRGGNYRRFRL